MPLRDRINSLGHSYIEFLKMGPPAPEGFVYYDLPKLTLSDLKEFLEVVGEENIQWITYNAQNYRGQMFLKKEAFETLNKYLEGKKDA